jgi:hypothetical protein
MVSGGIALGKVMAPKVQMGPQQGKLFLHMFILKKKIFEFFSEEEPLGQKS